jgi:hypothetical protein
MDRNEWMAQEPKKSKYGYMLYPAWNPWTDKGIWVTIPEDEEKIERNKILNNEK